MIDTPDEKELLEEDGLRIDEAASLVEAPVELPDTDDQPTGWSPDVTTRPPTIFDDHERETDVPPLVEYPDWAPGETFVVSGPLADSKFPGRRFATRGLARAFVKIKYGRIHQEIKIPGRWAFRVPKPRGTSGR